MNINDETLDRFVATFTIDHRSESLHPVPDEMLVKARTGDRRFYIWRPVHAITPPSELEVIYDVLPGRFPNLYEKLVLNYRWLEVQYDNFALFASPPGPLVDGILSSLTRDQGLSRVLFKFGFIPFAKRDCYDPICFNGIEAGRAGDCAIVSFNHEAILCNGVLGDASIVAPSFTELVVKLIQTGGA